MTRDELRPALEAIAARYPAWMEGASYAQSQRLRGLLLRCDLLLTRRGKDWETKARMLLLDYNQLRRELDV